MPKSASEIKKTPATEGPIRWGRCAVLGLVCALVIGFYAWSANPGASEVLGSGAQDSYYNLLVQGFRDGHLNVKREVPPGFAALGNDAPDPAGNAGSRWVERDPWGDMSWMETHGLHDLSYYKGKLYLYFGVTPALVLFWPCAALTGHYLSHRAAVVIFVSVGFLAGAALLCSVKRRYFKETGFAAEWAGILALGLANFTPAILARADVYEVAITCGYALTMLALCAIWRALHDGRHRWRWLAAASLAYGLAVGARPSLLFGAVILLVPVVQAWREKGRVWPLLLAVAGPIAMIGVGLVVYNALRFDNPLEFGQRYQLPQLPRVEGTHEFSPRYFWYDFQVGFLRPAHWSIHFPMVQYITPPPLPRGASPDEHPFGVLTNIPLVWLALAASAAWRNRTGGGRSNLRWFLAVVALLFGIIALTLCLHDSMALRYEMEFASPLVFLAVVGFYALERTLARQTIGRRAVRDGCGLLAAFSLVFNLLAGFQAQAQAHNSLGTALVQADRVDEAISQYQKALEIQPNHMDARFNLGNAFLQTGRVDTAITQYQKALEIQPNHIEARFALGSAFAQTGRMDDAISQYQKVLEIRPNHMDARLGLGKALVQEGRVGEAISQFQDAMRINPNSAPAHNNLGIVLLGKGKVDEAVALFQQALIIDPDYAGANTSLGNVLLQKGKVDEATEHFQKALQKEPDSAVAHNSLANALMQKGKLDEAIAHFQRALEIQPGAAPSHFGLAIAFMRSRHLDEAIMEYQKGLQSDPNFAPAYSPLGAALEERGRFGEAITAYQKAVQLNPSDLAALNNLAWLLATAPEASLRDGGKALGMARQADLQTGGENMVILHTLAAAYAETGKFPEAVQAAQHALRLAEAQSNGVLTGALQTELKLYQADSPFHSPEKPR